MEGSPVEHYIISGEWNKLSMSDIAIALDDLVERNPTTRFYFQSAFHEGDTALVITLLPVTDNEANDLYKEFLNAESDRKEAEFNARRL